MEKGAFNISQRYRLGRTIAERIVQQFKEFVTENMIHKWEKDFEYDNFGILRVVSEVNEVLRVKGYKETVRK